MKNQVTPHNVRPVDTTVGELEPGTIFRSECGKLWKMRRCYDDPTSTYMGTGVRCYEGNDTPVREIADSITIGPEVDDE